MPGWINHKLESKLLGEISTTSDMQVIPLIAGILKRNFKKHLDKSERGE